MGDQQSGENETCDRDTHMLGELAGEIQSDQPADRLRAVSVLGRFGTGPGALAALKLMTAEDPDADVRRQARVAYDRLKARVAAPLASRMGIRTATGGLDLKRLLQFIADPNPIHRIEAVLQAVETQDRAALQPLVDQLGREKDEWVVATLVRAIGVVGDASHVPLIVPYLDWDAHPRVISNALEALSRLDVRKAGPDIARMVDHRDPRVQAAAVVALYPIEREAARVCLQAMARSARPGSRAAAAHCLARLHDEACVDMLRQMVLDETDPELKSRFQAYVQDSVRHL